MLDIDADRRNRGVVSIFSTRMSNVLHLERSWGKSLPESFDGRRQHRAAKFTGRTLRSQQLSREFFGGPPGTTSRRSLPICRVRWSSFRQVHSLSKLELDCCCK